MAEAVAADALRRWTVDDVVAAVDEALAAPLVGGRLAVPLLAVDEDCADGGRRTVADDRVVADGGLEAAFKGGFVVVAVADLVAEDEPVTIDADLFRTWPRTGAGVVPEVAVAELPAADRVLVIWLNEGAAEEDDGPPEDVGLPLDEVGRPLDDVGRR